MNYARQQNRRFRTIAAFAAATVVLTLAVAAIPAQAQTPTVIYSFPGGSEPANPNAEAIAQGRDGNLYTTTAYGGTVGQTGGGTVFKITPGGTVTVVYPETSSLGPYGGAYPYSGVTLGTDGLFYGTNYYGGTGGHGEVYKVTAAGVVTPLHSFAGTGDGANPFSAPIEGTNGVFYGTTSSITATVNSTAYSVTSGGTFNTLHTFTGTDGQNVYAPLVQGTDGNFYGNTAAGGTGDGVIFKMAPSGAVTVLHTFAGTDGSNASYPLIQASDGNFYGTTSTGGSSNAGVVFKITAGGTYNVIYNLNGTTDGAGPSSGLVQATNGKLYGVTENLNVGLGTIFSVTTSGTFTTLYSFTAADYPDGGYPVSPLIQHTDGLLYGTTYVGGSPSNGCESLLYPGGEPTYYNGCGVFYKLNVGLGPFVSLLPRSGKEGAVIGILGQGFTSASVVKFDGVTAVSTTHGSTFISATVPAGALTGSVTVTTGATTRTSNKAFRVTPTFPSFNPTSGPVSTPVVLTGTGLTQTTKVTFGGVAATTVTVNSDTQVTADVPTGAVTGKIIIVTNGGIAESTTEFTVN